ncbi:MAG: sulfatase [Candidatus Zixiibacteriota bacterium]|jgi:arylsulfatase
MPGPSKTRSSLIISAARAALWLAGIYAVGFYWALAETLFIHRVIPTGYAFDRSFCEGFAGRSPFYVVLAAALAAVAWILFYIIFRIKRRGYPARRAAARSLSTTAALAVTYTAAVLVLYSLFRKLQIGAAKKPTAALTGVVIVLIVAGVFALFIRWRGKKPRLAQISNAVGYLALAFAIGAAGFALAREAYQPSRRPAPPTPDIVVITLDAWRTDMFNDRVMPNLFGFARDHGVIFENARSPSSWTLPSFASMLTGSYNVTPISGVEPPGENRPTWAEVMYENGYDTYAVISNPHLDTVRRHFRGFDDFYHVKHRQPFLKAIGYYDTLAYFILREHSSVPEIPGDTTSRIRDKALTTLLKSSRRPKFIWLHVLDPHFPYQPLPSLLKKERPDLMDKQDYGLDRKYFSEENGPILKGLYDAEAASTDFLLAPLVRELSDRPNTITIISSDHGEEFYEHGGDRHGYTLYDEVTRVPFAIILPEGKPAPISSPATEAPVSLTALGPSILNYLGFKLPATMDGYDGLLAEYPLNEETVYGFLPKADAFRASMVKGNRKIILTYTNDDVSTEYFDLTNDPGELHPLPLDAEGRKYEEEVKSWVEGNRRFLAETGAEASVFGQRKDLKALGYM